MSFLCLTSFKDSPSDMTILKLKMACKVFQDLAPALLIDLLPSSIHYQFPSFPGLLCAFADAVTTTQNTFLANCFLRSQLRCLYQECLFYVLTSFCMSSSQYLSCYIINCLFAFCNSHQIVNSIDVQSYSSYVSRAQYSA